MQAQITPVRGLLPYRGAGTRTSGGTELYSRQHRDRQSDRQLQRNQHPAGCNACRQSRQHGRRYFKALSQPEGMTIAESAEGWCATGEMDAGGYALLLGKTDYMPIGLTIPDAGLSITFTSFEAMNVFRPDVLKRILHRRKVRLTVRNRQTARRIPAVTVIRTGNGNSGRE